MNAPELTSKEAVFDFYSAVMAATGIVMVELRHGSCAASSRWLARQWDTYFTPERQEKILVEFTTRRLTK